MWGVGAAVGPYILGAVLAGGGHWSGGYRTVGFIQLALTVVLFLSLPLWKERYKTEEGSAAKPLPLKAVLTIPGARQIMVTFFCYCALEQTTALWASSYLTLYKGVPTDTAAFFASMFFIGITAGRALNGFLTVKFTDTQLIRMGQIVILLGICAMLLPLGEVAAIVGLILIGFGCAPIYPCVIHSTPEHFGEEHSQALIGIQMASAYTGICVMPPLFGILANHISAGLFPWYMLALNALMYLMTEELNRKTAR